MADLRNDIEKYLKGQLDPAAMHALEKKALTDPFLAEALEGVDSIKPGEFSVDVDELNRRIARKGASKRFWVMRIAASVALLIGTSYIVYTLTKADQPVTLAQNASKETPAPPKENPATDSISTPAKGKADEQFLTLNRPAHAQPRAKTKVEDKSAKQLSEPTVAAAETDDSKSGPAEVASAPTTQVHELEQLKEAEKIALDDKVVAGESSGVKKEEAVSQRAVRSKKDLGGAPPKKPAQQVISGKVTAVEDDSPIPGVNVVIKGTTQGVISDEKGNFQLFTGAQDNDLVFSFIGYQTQEVKITSGQPPVIVRLPADLLQLSEIVVVGYAEKGDEREPVIKLAEPAGGRKAYNKYLESNLHYPQQALEKKIEGKVTIEFKVETDGDLSDFAVIRGLDFGCNEEVIRLVKEGPQWRPSSEADVPIESTVRVRMKFKLPK